ncbi:iron dicitrate transport regulator FecR [Leptolyngbya sp. 'hensonii']|nr:iron dicitrate transport regulator FecR [Leptolyngbya sp. 'hensonii']
MALLASSMLLAGTKPVSVRVNRWIVLRKVSGQVNYLKGAVGRPARLGDRLQAVGEGISTGPQSSAVLEVDTGIGLINVAEKTLLRVLALKYAADNGRITQLKIEQGQVRLRLRSFTHRGTRLEIQTPAGVSGVRGTEFGIVVTPNGKTGIATLTGNIETSAQGESVLVPGGFQNLLMPGFPPTQPVPLRDSTQLQYRWLQVVDGGIRKLRLIGQVDPVNGVLVNQVPQAVDRNGAFSLLFPVPNRLRLQVTVVTPLGKRQVHELEAS